MYNNRYIYWILVFSVIFEEQKIILLGKICFLSFKFGVNQKFDRKNEFLIKLFNVVGKQIQLFS